jgi:YggT family protein
MALASAPGLAADSIGAADIWIRFISILSTVLVVAIIIRALLSWFAPNDGTGLSRVLMDVTEPVLAPIRRVLPPVGGIDFSPILAIILVTLVGRLLISVLNG